jgi:hypothetical protein
MKIDMRTFLGLVIGATITLAGQRAGAAEPTAFELVKEGNKHVGEDAKDRIVQIRSDKSVGSLTPNLWHIVFYDPDASLKATEVTFAAGKKLSVKRPSRLLEPITRSHKPLDRDKLKLDSDKAIEIATKDPMLKNLKLTNTQLWLERSDDGPRWKVRLWAEKVRNPSSTAEIGQIYISAQDGKVLERDLHINRAD